MDGEGNPGNNDIQDNNGQQQIDDNQQIPVDAADNVNDMGAGQQ